MVESSAWRSAFKCISFTLRKEILLPALQYKTFFLMFNFSSFFFVFSISLYPSACNMDSASIGEWLLHTHKKIYTMWFESKGKIMMLFFLATSFLLPYVVFSFFSRARSLMIWGFNFVQQINDVYCVTSNAISITRIKKASTRQSADKTLKCFSSYTFLCWAQCK